VINGKELLRPFKSERTRRVAADADTVMNLLADSGSWPHWQPEIRSIEDPASLATGDVVRGEAGLLGFDVHGHSTTTEVGPGVFEEDVVVGIRMRVRYEVRPAEGGSEVTHRLVAQMPAGAAGRVLAFFLRPRLRKLQRDALLGLARSSESGISSL
jgi:Polyketide cyclase / dehydrase and lipid transport